MFKHGSGEGENRTMDTEQVLHRIEQWIRQEALFYGPRMLTIEQGLPLPDYTGPERTPVNEIAALVVQNSHQTRGDFALTVDLGAVESELLFLVIKCIAKSKDKTVDEVRLKEVLERLEYSLNWQSFPDRSWAFLHQFDCLERFVTLDGPARIRRTTIIEDSLFKQYNHSVGGRTVCRFVAETKQDARVIYFSDDGSINPIVNNEFVMLVSSLRLASPSSVGINRVSVEVPAGNFGEQSPAVAIPFYSAPEVFPAAFSRFVNTQCVLDKYELELFGRLHTGLRKVVETGGENADRLQRSLRRFNAAICSGQIEDIVVDTIIGLEILFHTTGFRTSFLASHLAAIGASERKTVADQLDKSYDLRNRIVHGGSLKEGDSHLAIRLLTIFCRVLRSYIYLATKMQDIDGYIRRIPYDPDELAKLENELARWSRAETSWVWKPSEPPKAL